MLDTLRYDSVNASAAVQAKLETYENKIYLKHTMKNKNK